MRIGLHKAYINVDWEFLQLILHKIGFGVKMVDWIMTCNTTVNYTVIINGIPSDFFKHLRGLRHGYALSPLHLLLVIYGLSRCINDDRSKGVIIGCRIYKNIHITHSMFIDNFLFIGHISLVEQRAFHNILTIFGTALALYRNKGKSVLILDSKEKGIINQIENIYEVD